MFHDVNCPNLPIQKVVMCIVLPLHFYLGIITPAICLESTSSFMPFSLATLLHVLLVQVYE